MLRSLMLRKPMERCRSAPPRAQESYFASTSARGGPRKASGCDASRLRIPVGKCRICRGRGAAGLKWIGPRPESFSLWATNSGPAKSPALPACLSCPASGGLPKAKSGARGSGRRVGYPLLVKASAGGGGIGMRRVDNEAEQLVNTAVATQSMAGKSFGDGSIFLERFVPKARHIEIQVFGFGDGRQSICSNAIARCSGDSRKSSKRAPRRDCRTRPRRWRMRRCGDPRGPATKAPERSNSSSMRKASNSISWK